MAFLKIDVKKAENHQTNEDTKQMNENDCNGTHPKSKYVFSAVTEQIYISGNRFVTLIRLESCKR